MGQGQVGIQHPEVQRFVSCLPWPTQVSHPKCLYEDFKRPWHTTQSSWVTCFSLPSLLPSSQLFVIGGSWFSQVHHCYFKTWIFALAFDFSLECLPKLFLPKTFCSASIWNNFFFLRPYNPHPHLTLVIVSLCNTLWPLLSCIFVNNDISDGWSWSQLLLCSPLPNQATPTISTIKSSLMS